RRRPGQRSRSCFCTLRSLAVGVIRPLDDKQALLFFPPNGIIVIVLLQLARSQQVFDQLLRLAIRAVRNVFLNKGPGGALSPLWCGRITAPIRETLVYVGQNRVHFLVGDFRSYFWRCPGFNGLHKVAAWIIGRAVAYRDADEAKPAGVR